MIAKDTEALMPFLYLESLPPRTTKGDILHLLCGVGGIGREQVGRIELRGAVAVVEVPDGWEVRLVKALAGADMKGRRLRARAAGAATATGPDDHFARLAQLVRLESTADATAALEKSRRLS